MPDRIVSTPLLALLLAACAVGPDYQPPADTAPEHFIHQPPATEAATPPQTALQMQARFWNGFNDPMLAQLVLNTLDNNQELTAALAHYQRSAAQLQAAKRNLLPRGSVAADATESHLPQVERLSADGAERIERYQVAGALSWELDLFGRLQRIREGRQAQLDASAADLEALQITLVAQLAAQYFELRGRQQKLQVAIQNLRLQRESLAIVTARVQAGRSTRFDQVRAQAQMESTAAILPQLQADIAALMHRIATLSGLPAGHLNAQLGLVQDLPRQLPAVDLDTPAEVLRRRPDVRAAERELAARTAAIGAAQAQWFPRLELSALVGSVAADPGDLFTGASASRRAGLSIHWPLLDFGRVSALVDSADADARAALARYRQTVLIALEETETELVRYQQSQHRTAALERSANAAATAAQLARTRYGQGYIDFFEVLAAEQELIEIQGARVQSRTEQTLAMVNLYRAMAGPPGGFTPVSALPYNRPRG